MSDTGSGVISRNTEYLLIETIRQVGVSNYSLIARLTGLSAKTVRYKVNKQLSKLGLGILVNIDYAQLARSADREAFYRAYANDIRPTTCSKGPSARSSTSPRWA